MLFPKTPFIDQKMPAAHRDHTTTAKDSTSTLDRTGPRFAELLSLVTPGDIVLCLNSETWSSKGCICSPILSHLVLQGCANSKAPSKASNEWRLIFLNFRTRWILVAQLMSQNALHGAVNVVAGHLLRATPSRTNHSEKVDDLGRMENLN